MRIIINAVPLLSKLTGVGNYIFNISQKLLELYPEYKYTFYYGYTSNKLIMTSDMGKGRISVLGKKILKTIPYGRDFVRAVVKQMKYKGFDIYFEPNFIPYLNVTAQTITTVHDFSFYQKEWELKERYQFFYKNFLKYIYKSKIIITPSEYIKKEFLNKLTFPEERVVVIHHGIDVNLYNQNRIDYKDTNLLHDIEKLGNYILFVGAIQPRKNIKGLIDAYTILPQSFQKELPLLIVGHEGWVTKNVSEMVETNENIHVLNSVSDNKELAALYRKALLFVFPSFYEGFGFPPLEAMACGCPVVVSNTSSLPEVCGDAACYVDPYNTESIAEGIMNVIEDRDLRKNMIQKGLERVKLFTWEKSAHKHQEVFKKALES